MEAETRKISELEKKGKWGSLKAKVVQLWESESDAISQVGLLADESGQIKFVAWKKSNLPLLEEGKSYLFKSAVIDSWNGKKQISLNSRTKISPIDEEIKSSVLEEVEGNVLNIIPKSGFIERCPECNRVLINDHCPVHLDVKPDEDMRVKVSLDTTSKIVVANGEIAKKLVGLSLEQAKKMEKEDLNCLIDVKLVGKKYRFKGKDFDNNFIVDDFLEIGE